MSLERIEDFTTRLLTEADADQTPVSEIYVAGHATGKRVSGAYLEAAVRVGRRILVFMTDDVPFEDTLGIVLLDADLNVLDEARLGGLYASGAFSELELHPPNTVSFRFIGGTEWSVEVLDRRGARVPFVPEAPGVVRPFSFRRHFVVRGKPLPQR
jgi:hypothetical protein